MKILHVNGARSWGGNEQQLLYLVRGLNSKGIEQALFCYHKNPLLDIFKEDEIKIFNVAYKKPYSFDFLKKFSAVVKSYAPDIIHVHTGNFLTGYVLADLFYGLAPKVVLSKKGISRNMSFLSKFKYNYRKIDKIICVSERVKDDLEHVISLKNKSKLEIVWDGVTWENWEPISLKSKYNLPEDAFVIGNIGNHTRSKDLKTLINTANYLVNKKGYKNLYFFQIGHFSGLTDELKELVNDLNLNSNFFMLGFQENASSYFSAFDLFLMSSKKEGGPTSVLEAMIYKTPVVSTNVGVIPYAIRQAENGFYAEVEEYEDLGDYIEKLYENEELREQFVEKSFHICKERFSVECLVQKTLDIYQNV